MRHGSNARRAGLLVALFPLLVAYPVRAQRAPTTPISYDTSLFAGLSYRNVGPVRGGRSTAVAGSAARPHEYYFGATGGGLWKTVDGGTTWRPVTDGQVSSASVGAVAVCEANPDVVYIGMGETELRGNILQGDGVYKSTDGGKKWQHMGLAETQAISRIRIRPDNCDEVFVAALGHPYGPNPERGIFKSTDGGRTWRKVLYRDDKTGAEDLSMDPHDPRVLYASLWEVYRTSWSLSSGGPGSGLFKSTDDGETWTELTRNAGLPQGIIGKIGVAVSPADAQRVYAIVEADSGGVFRSDDGGATWQRTNNERKLRQRAFYYTRIYADPLEKDVVYVLNTGFYRSEDAGKTFPKTYRVPHGDNHDLWIAPNDNQRMINANDGGANVSVTGGDTWTAQDFPTAQLYHIIATNHMPYWVCGAQQDNSTACVPSSGWRQIAEPVSVGGGESGYIASDPDRPNIFYAGSYGGLLTRYDFATGTEQVIGVWPDNPMGHSADDIRERFQWTFPIVFSQTGPKTLYVGSQHLWQTTDEGQSWTRISDDLTRHDPKTMGPSGGPITLDQTGVETYATIFTIAPSPHDANTIWTGSDDGYVFLTRDGGRTWTNVTPKDLPDFARISLIEVSPHRAGAAYLAAKRYQSDDTRPYIYRTDDYGKTWVSITKGIPQNDFVHAVREDPVRPYLLYAGTEHGVYVSFDNGLSWQAFSRNLPDVEVPDLVIKGNDLVIATHGRSAYIMDDISPLRQLSPEVVAANAYLFSPANAIRGLDNSVTVTYHLAAPAQKVTLDFLDASGKPVRSFTGTPDTTRARGAAGERAGGGGGRRFGQAPRVSVKAGNQRFRWDMRYPGATRFPNLILWAAGTNGPRALPGRYQVRLSVDGKPVATRDFSIDKDPRFPAVTMADLQAQFDLAMKVRNRTSDANDGVIEIRDIKSQVEDRIAKQSSLKEAGTALERKLSIVEDSLYQVRNRSSQDPLNFPIRLNNELAALMGAVEGVEGQPTKPAYEVFDTLSARLQVQLDALEAILAHDLVQFNQQLRSNGLDPIEVKARKPQDVTSP